MKAVFLLVVALARCKSEGHTTKAKVKLSQARVTQLGREAHPQWSVVRPEQACPNSLADLKPYLFKDSEQATFDAWDHPLKMHCGATANPAAGSFGVSSFGPDGVDDNGSGDDLVSWD